MTIKSVIGANVLIGSAYGALLPMTDISNANPAVGTLSSTAGLVSNDEVAISTSWDRANGRVTKITLAASLATFLGVDTSNINLFPAAAGAAAGSGVREITWTTIGQIREWTSSGGETEFEDITTIADYVRKNKPTQKSAVNFDMVIFWDPKLSWWPIVQGLSESMAEYPFKIVLAGATDILYGMGYIQLGKVPTITGTLLTTRLGFTIASDITVL